MIVYKSGTLKMNDGESFVLFVCGLPCIAQKSRGKRMGFRV